MSGASLLLSDVGCRRGGRMLFSGLGLQLRAGQSGLVTGPNGLGKSSLLRIVAGLLPPAEGRIERNGTVALADESHALDTDRTLAQALGFWARIDGAAPARIEGALDDVALAHLAAVPVRMLSTGQRKRAALARTLVAGADIWLLDEPANGLDHDSSRRLDALVHRHLSGGGIVLAASHVPLAWPHRHEFTLHVPWQDDAEEDL